MYDFKHIYMYVCFKIYICIYTSLYIYIYTLGVMASLAVFVDFKLAYNMRTYICIYIYILIGCDGQFGSIC